MTRNMDRRAAGALGLALVALSAAGAANAQDADAVERGRERFEYMCAPCHGDGPGDDGRAMLPGTDALRIKYRGALPALLTERSDLTYESIRMFVRQGVFSMPPFRPTELTDEEIRDIAAYIAESAE
jgi:mono/diheme cytochrome c family protein